MVKSDDESSEMTDLVLDDHEILPMSAEAIGPGDTGQQEELEHVNDMFLFGDPTPE